MVRFLGKLNHRTEVFTEWSARVRASLSCGEIDRDYFEKLATAAEGNRSVDNSREEEDEICSDRGGPACGSSVSSTCSDTPSNVSRGHRSFKCLKPVFLSCFLLQLWSGFMRLHPQQQYGLK